MERAEFRALFDSVCSWGRWGAGDERGALNYLTPQRVAEAAGLVSSGETVTLSLPLNTRAGPDNPAPVEHRMTMLGEAGAGPGEMGFAKDYIGVDYHNESHSHIDALCHVELDGTLYNGRPGSTITREGASTDAIAVLENGLVGRGVLLDIPRLRGVPWLEPGEHVFPEDLELCERSLGLTVAEGDILLVVGHGRRLAEHGPWEMAEAKAGLHPTCARFLAERRVAVLGSDGNNDTAPSAVEGIGFPDACPDAELDGRPPARLPQSRGPRRALRASGRWEFLFTAAPLRIVGGTGSPLNPTAIF